jgi:hypothetical protein
MLERFEGLGCLVKQGSIEGVLGRVEKGNPGARGRGRDEMVEHVWARRAGCRDKRVGVRLTCGLGGGRNASFRA